MPDSTETIDKSETINTQSSGGPAPAPGFLQVIWRRWLVGVAEVSGSLIGSRLTQATRDRSRSCGARKRHSSGSSSDGEQRDTRSAHGCSWYLDESGPTNQVRADDF